MNENHPTVQQVRESPRRAGPAGIQAEELRRVCLEASPFVFNTEFKANAIFVLPRHHVRG